MPNAAPSLPPTAIDITVADTHFGAYLNHRLSALYRVDDSDYPKALERLHHELAVLQKEKYAEYFMDLADVVILANQTRLCFWCL